MNTLPCPSCGLRVLELEGQFSILDSLYINDGSPPPETSGWWHARCLAESDVAPLWYEARLRNFRDVRGYQPVAEYARWTVLREPNRSKLLAFGRGGEILNLSRGHRKKARAADGGRIYPKTEEMFHLEFDDLDLAQTIQERLMNAGSYPLLDVLNAIGISDKLVHPEALDRGVFRFDKGLQRDWDKRSVSAGAEYGVFVPAELEAHVGEFVR
jgi:hypothetical protein